MLLQPLMQVVQELKCDLGHFEEPQELKMQHELMLIKVQSTLVEFSQKVTTEVQLNRWFYDGIISILEQELNLVVHSHSLN